MAMRSVAFGGFLAIGVAELLGGPDPKNIPADFMCAWRRLTLDYTKQVRPDIAGLAYDAMDLKTYCGDNPPKGERVLFPANEAPDAEAVLYVDASKGSDNADGSEAKPMKTAHAALRKLRSSKQASSAIVFRGGYHYFAETLDITPDDVNLTLQNYPGEEAWLTGALELKDLEWKEYDVQPAEEVVMENTDNAKHCNKDDPADERCGCASMDGSDQCQAACDDDDRCTAWTYHTTTDIWATKCCLRRDNVWNPKSAKDHISGYRSGKNIWQVDLSAYDFAEISELRVDGERMTPARYPNANAELDIFPVGYLKSDKADWLPPKISPSPNTAQKVDFVGRPWSTEFSNYSGGIGGTCAVFDPPFSYWCSDHFRGNCGACRTFELPGGLTFGDKLNKTYKNMENAILYAWRSKHWANWAFEIDSYHPENSTFIFGKGGFQGARGSYGSDWFISHVLEELDAPTEFYYSPSAKKLYYYPERHTTGAPPASTKFEVVLRKSLVRALGTQAKPVKGLRVLGLGFRDTANTMMEPHGVPSGGDWSLERMGVLLLEGVEDTTVDRVKMWKIGGNGIMLSKYAMRSRIMDSEFVWFGGTAVALWGWTDEVSDDGIHGIDGTGGDFPRQTMVERNVFREIGIFEKQASGFFQAKAAETTLRHNVAFNLARAGFNFNDGFGGGDQVYENVLFNTCRESADHGPINSWDRQPYLTTVLNGTPTTQMAFRDITRNVVISNYGGWKEVDNDDGSLFYKIHHNFMAYGWGQKFKCGGIESFNNVKAFIDLGGRFDVGCTTGPSAFYPNLWHDDIMVHVGTKDFDYRLCWGSDDAGHDWDKTQVHDNTIYTVNEDVHAIVMCGDDRIKLTDFQKHGNDPGSKELYGYPPTDTIMQWVREAIGENWQVEAHHSLRSLLI